ncbi:MAG TPA: hypothetical protein VFU15_05130, partial [Bacteroidia bacterium]|nr:hypothetical protein [Bacteroidia bacterium]
MKKQSNRSSSLFYTIERTLRQMRFFLQSGFSGANVPLSVDQWIVLAEAGRKSGRSHRDIALHTAKDPA